MTRAERFASVLAVFRDAVEANDYELAQELLDPLLIASADLDWPDNLDTLFLKWDDTFRLIFDREELDPDNYPLQKLVSDFHIAVVSERTDAADAIATADDTTDRVRQAALKEREVEETIFDRCEAVRQAYNETVREHLEDC